jgi:hypothetical protein
VGRNERTEVYSQIGERQVKRRLGRSGSTAAQYYSVEAHSCRPVQSQRLGCGPIQQTATTGKK